MLAEDRKGGGVRRWSNFLPLKSIPGVDWTECSLEFKLSLRKNHSLKAEL